MIARKLVFALVATVPVACSSTHDPHLGGTDDEVKVDTRAPAARAQYDADVAFLSGYQPTCAQTDSGRPRIMVTGFGRFLGLNDNATGRIISTLVPGSVYPETTAPPAGQVDPPAPQLNVVSTTLDLPQTGLVDVCAMILPVYWDLASILIAKEMDAFQPSFVMMNGVAGARQPIWIELGATNRAEPAEDGSSQLTPVVNGHDLTAKIIDIGEDARPNLLSWNAVHAAALVPIKGHAADIDQDTRFADVLQGALIGGFPRDSNTYLCNNVTYVTSYLMAHPGKEVRLLRASVELKNHANDVRVTMQGDFRNTPHVFVHWPADMATMHHAAGADVMAAILDAQLIALARGDTPTFGDNKLADGTLQGGKTF